MNLSIIIPLYNEENLIKELLDKLNNLSYPEFVKNVEIIIVDDFSTDNSYTVVKKYIKDFENIKIYRHNKNGGKGAAVHTGIKPAT